MEIAIKRDCSKYILLALYCNHSATPSSPAMSNLAIECYNSLADTFSVNDVPNGCRVLERGAVQSE